MKYPVFCWIDNSGRWERWGVSNYKCTYGYYANFTLLKRTTIKAKKRASNTLQLLYLDEVTL